MHVMIDIETMSTQANASIFQIGAMAFEFASGGKVYNSKGFQSWINLQSSLDAGLDINASTVAWWMTQDKNARMDASVGMQYGPSLSVALDGLDRWISDRFDGENWETVEGIWAKPITFDITILTSAYQALGRETPWHWRSARDLRTLFHCAGGEPGMMFEGTPHNALDDCEHQICQLQMALQQMGA